MLGPAVRPGASANCVPAVLGHQRLDDAGAIAAQVAGVEHAAQRFHVLDDSSGDLPFVVVAAPGAGEAFQRGGEPLELEPLERGAGSRHRRKPLGSQMSRVTG